MNSKPTKEHLDAFVAHTIGSLPDSINLRKTILVTALALLPREAVEQRQRLKALIESLRAHEDAQLEFSGLVGPKGDGI